jgi:hypothetical protein
MCFTYNEINNMYQDYNFFYLKCPFLFMYLTLEYDAYQQRCTL